MKTLRPLSIAAIVACQAHAATDFGSTGPGTGSPDGLCDVWQSYFHAWGLAAAADDDGDGASNLEESIAGTDPWEMNDRLRVSQISGAAGALTFGFPAERGKQYRLRRASAPDPPQWEQVAGSEKTSLLDHAFDSIVITQPLDSPHFFRLEVQDIDADGDGASDWAEYRRGTDPETLAGVAADFATSSGEQPVFAETFTHGSRFALGRFLVGDGFARGLPGEFWPQLSYFFDRPLDVRAGEIVVYWAFRADRSAGEEFSKLSMHLPFTDVPTEGFPEPAHLSFIIRPGAWSWLVVDPGWLLPHSAEMRVVPQASLFVTAEDIERFRLSVRWLGGDTVQVEPTYWNRVTGQWQPFLQQYAPGDPPAILLLSIQTHLLSHTTFKSLFLQPYSDNPSIDSVLVTFRPIP